MADFSLPSFNRRYVLVPMLAAIALVSFSFHVGEQRRSHVMRLAEVIRDRQDRLRLLADFNYAAADAESAQRGYLLTGDRDYLAPLEDSRQRAQADMGRLLQRYGVRDRAELQHLRTAMRSLQQKFSEIDTTIGLMRRKGGPAQALRLVKTDIGIQWMRSVRTEIEGISDRERDRVYRSIADWEREIGINRTLSAGTSLFSILLIVVTGMLVTRDLERRHAAAGRLDALVAERTRELTDLSRELLRVREHEKAALARELHDELGGLLVAIKMDLSQLARRIDLSSPDVRARLQRIQDALAAGIALKRRVIEDLRPTLLDNMGLVAAIRWQLEEVCRPAGIEFHLEAPDTEPVVGADAAIAVFRVVQESLTNVVKHARATVVELRVVVDASQLMVEIRDDGVGLSAAVTGSPAGHQGLVGMRYRMQAVGGSFAVSDAPPRGTRVRVHLPLTQP